MDEAPGERALDESDVDPDPVVQFERWFAEARAAGLAQPEAMALATTGADGQPSARMVLLKHADAGGFVFYTNFNARKSHELAKNPRAALLFFWGELQRQVRIEGTVTRVEDGEADAYFATRPRDSAIGAWASPQSEVIADRAALLARVAERAAELGDGPIARPPHWGGYRLRPTSIELWQGRAGRLHDRLRYRLDAATRRFVIERLAP